MRIGCGTYGSSAAARAAGSLFNTPRSPGALYAICRRSFVVGWNTTTSPLPNMCTSTVFGSSCGASANGSRIHSTSAGCSNDPTSTPAASRSVERRPAQTTNTSPSTRAPHRRGLHELAAEFAIEVGVPLQHAHLHAVAGEQVREHHAGGAGPDDDDLGITHAAHPTYVIVHSRF